MRILVDENIPLSCVGQLSRLGHDVLDIRGTPDEGLTDDLLWAMACNEERLLITTDRGFAHNRLWKHFGILIVALRQPTGAKITRRAILAVEQFDPNEWPGLLVIMRDTTMSTWRPKKEE
ncbi:MAG: DUF5615 family PIN-like protein [Phycisphaerae bacterium]|nr:DUF5615 family PIN-like protein [Phycisphaerae bacterium]